MDNRFLMKKYILIFTLVYLALSLIAGLAAMLFDFNNGIPMSILAVLIASYTAARMFVKDCRRLPTLNEKKSYAWQACLGSLLVSIFLTMVSYALLDSDERQDIFELLGESDFVIYAVMVMFVITLLQYSGLRWFFAVITAMLNKSIAQSAPPK